MAPEAHWWTRSGKPAPDSPKDWLWTLMVVVPDFTNKTFFEAVEELRERKNPPGLDRARLEPFDKGYCVQAMRIGPYPARAETISKMEAYAREDGYVMVGKDHEIYFGDPRRTAPSKPKTLIRHPVTEDP